MIPTIPISERARRPPRVQGLRRCRFSGPSGLLLTASLLAAAGAAAGTAAVEAAGAKNCLPSGDGYLRAHIGGALDAEIDWPNSGTACEGESKTDPVGVRLSFRRVAGSRPNLLFVFGLTGVREGEPLRDSAANLTIIVQGTDRIYGTRGDSRCTVDSLTQRRLEGAHEYRLEARGFCTQPAHAVRGEGVVMVSRFDFAGIVNYASEPEERRDP
jgi:hypothetical protein